MVCRPKGKKVLQTVLLMLEYPSYLVYCGIQHLQCQMSRYEVRISWSHWPTRPGSHTWPGLMHLWECQEVHPHHQPLSLNRTLGTPPCESLQAWGQPKSAGPMGCHLAIGFHWWWASPSHHTSAHDTADSNLLTGGTEEEFFALVC